MCARSPEDSREEDMQNKMLHPSHDGLNKEARGLAAPEHRPSVLPARQDEAPDTKVELDRVELYLKGPTVFTA